MAEYWEFHATFDLDAYVACAQEAKEAGLPVVIGLEVDFYGAAWTTSPTCWPGTPSTCCSVRCTGWGAGGSTT